MTKTEAIDLLDNLIGFVEDSQNNDYDSALKMAIEALQKEDKPRQFYWTCHSCRKQVPMDIDSCPFCGFGEGV